MAISRPRTSRMASLSSVARSRPRKVIEPPTIRAGSSSSRMIDLAHTLLPEPDSPTMPRVSPAKRSKLTPSTARTGPASVRNQVRRSLTLRIGASPRSRMRIQPVPDAVAHEIEAKHHRKDGNSGEGRAPPLLHELTPVGDHRTPFGSGRHHAEAEERQASEHQDCIAE